MKLRLRERLERARADGAVPEASAPASRPRSRCWSARPSPPSTRSAPRCCRSARSSAACCPASAWRTRRRRTSSSPRPGRSGWPSASRAATPCCSRPSTAASPSSATAPWGERTSLRGLARTLIDQRDLEPLATPRRSTPTPAGRSSCEGRASTRARRGRARGRPAPARLRSLVTVAEKSSLFEGPGARRAPLPARAVQANFGLQAALAHARGARRGPEDRGVDAEGARRPGPRRAERRLHGRLVRALQGVVRIYERKKPERGVLDFLDLLVKARDALRDRESVRRYFRSASAS